MSYPPQPGQPGGRPPQPGQWGPPPGAPYPQYQNPQYQYPGLPPGGPKNRTPLIVGLVLAAVLIIGGIVVLVVVLGKNDSPSAGSSPPAAPAPASSTSRSAAGGINRATGQDAAQSLAAAYSKGDASGVAALACGEFPPIPILAGATMTIDAPVVEQQEGKGRVAWAKTTITAPQQTFHGDIEFAYSASLNGFCYIDSKSTSGN